MVALQTTIYRNCDFPFPTNNNNIDILENNILQARIVGWNINARFSGQDFMLKNTETIIF